MQKKTRFCLLFDVMYNIFIAFNSVFATESPSQIVCTVHIVCLRVCNCREMFPRPCDSARKGLPQRIRSFAEPAGSASGPASLYSQLRKIRKFIAPTAGPGRGQLCTDSCRLAHIRAFSASWAGRSGTGRAIARLLQGIAFARVGGLQRAGIGRLGI